jgi:hypothetical protein
LPTRRFSIFLFAAITAVATALPTRTVIAQVAEPILTRSSYSVISGQDTIWQYIIRSPGHFQTDVVLEKQGATLKMAATADDSGLVRKVGLDVWRFPPGESKGKLAHAQQARYELGRDSVIGNVDGARGHQTQAYPAPPGSMIFQWEYVAFLEQLAFRARALGGSTATIPVYFFGTQGYVLPATVRFPVGTDSVIISLGEEVFRLVLNKYKRIESGSSGKEKILRVAFHDFFPADTNITKDLRCPESALRQDLAAIRADTLVGRVLSLYPGAMRARDFRVLRNDADLAVCKNLLDLFPPQGIAPQLVELGDVYMMVVGPIGARAAVGIVSHDLSVVHFTMTAH